MAPPKSLPDAIEVRGPSIDETWQAVRNSCADRKKETDAGRLIAPANPDENGSTPDKESKLTADGRLDVVPPCRYCEFDALCGVIFAEPQ